MTTQSLELLFPNEKFNNLLSEHLEAIHKILEESPTDIYIPEIIVFELDGKKHKIKVTLSDETKYETMRQVGKLCCLKGLKPVAAIMAFEAWTIEKTLDSVRSSRPISEYADKKEMLCIVGMAFDGRGCGVMARFDRNPEDNSIILNNASITFPCNKHGEEASIKSDLLRQFFYGYAHQAMAFYAQDTSDQN
jgi:hypothetical protein